MADPIEVVSVISEMEASLFHMFNIRSKRDEIHRAYNPESPSKLVPSPDKMSGSRVFGSAAILVRCKLCGNVLSESLTLLSQGKQDRERGR